MAIRYIGKAGGYKVMNGESFIGRVNRSGYLWTASSPSGRKSLGHRTRASAARVLMLMAGGKQPFPKGE